MKRSPLTRKTPLKRGSWSHKSSPLPAGTKPARKTAIKARVKKASKADREHMGIVAGLCCVVCRNLGFGESPAEVHHVRYLAGAGQRSSNRDTIPLCVAHHRLGGWGVAFHAGPAEFERRYGTEAELLAQTKRELGIEMEEAA